ncbi:RNA polymerase sigma-70 factor [Hanamia caeni]|uniref:RNA polymerase sigma factor n=2 Tax=Hanamia caeni TaxID=2294116 RepID=A0A3M9N725_9BACT|nr:RNA polymerase sigma-70 factor [Hanamia caeni]
MLVYDLYDMREYFQRLAKGDASAFETIFELYKRRVFGVALKMLKSETDAEEVVQDVFLSIWLAKRNLGQVNEPEAYLFTITYNTIYSRLKKASHNQELLNTIIQHLTEIQNTTAETIAARETGKLINEAIQQLPPQQRTVYELSKQEGLKYDEIAELMHLSKNTVRNHLSEAMKTIRTFLKKTEMLFMSLVILLIC